MPLITRAEAVTKVKELMHYTIDKQDLCKQLGVRVVSDETRPGPFRHHFGKVEVEALLDAIYGPPTSKEETLVHRETAQNTTKGR